MDVVFTDGMAVDLASILHSTVTVDYSSFQCGLSSHIVFQCMDAQIRFHVCFHYQTKDAEICTSARIRLFSGK